MTIKPGRSDVHVNRPLTNISVAYIQDAKNFVADRVFPNIPVAKQSDMYFTYDRGDFNRDDMQARAPGTESSGSGYDIDNTPTYFCRMWAHHKNVPDEVRDNADTPINPDAEATTYVTLKALIRRERLWSSKFFVGGVWTGDVDGVAASPGAGEVLRWDNASSSPIENVRAAKRSVLERTGFEPNTLTLGRAVYDALVDHPDIVGRMDRGQTNGPAMANIMALAALFEVEQVLVSNAIVNTANSGAAEASSFINGKKALLTYSPSSPGLMTPSAGYTFSWTGRTGMSTSGTRIRRFRMEAIQSDRVEIDMAIDQKLVSADLGYFWDNIVS